MIATARKNASNSSLSVDRITRLHRFVEMLASGPKTRAMVMRRLKMKPRGFYRDFEKLRSLGVPLEMHEGRYVLMESLAETLHRLPFPNPMLSVQEAILLSKGKSPVHRKLRAQLLALIGEKY